MVISKTALAGIAVAGIVLAIGVMFPSGRPPVPQNQTMVRIKTLVTAIKQYESQYGVLPSPIPDERLLTQQEYEAMIRWLVGDNARGIRFLEPTDLQTLEYLDADGRPFKVILDVDYDGKLTGPHGKMLDTNTAVWSTGEDPADPKDDITSWRD